MAEPLKKAMTGAESAAQAEAWRQADEHKDRGNRRYAVKNWEEALQCYLRAVATLENHPHRHVVSTECSAVREKAASYHSNAAAALMQMGRCVCHQCTTRATARARWGSILRLKWH